MSARALNWAWQQSPSSAQEKLVLAALADRADDEGSCFPSLRWIAVKCAPMSERSVRRYIDKLAEDGLVVKAKRKRREDGTLGTWDYLLPIPVTSGQQWPVDAPEPVANSGHAETLSTSEVPDGTSADAGDSVEKTGEERQGGKHSVRTAFAGEKQEEPHDHPEPVRTPMLDELWDACEAFVQLAPETKSPRSAYAKLVREMLAAGWTPGDVRRRAKRYRKRFPGMELTVAALAKWGEELDRGKRTLTEGNADNGARHGDDGAGVPSVSVLPPAENARRMRELAERTVGALDGAGAFLSTPAPSSAQPHGSQSGALTGEPAPTLPVGSPHPS